MKVVLKISFLSLSNANLQFSARELNWRFYTIIETLLIIRKVEFYQKIQICEDSIGLSNANLSFSKSSNSCILVR